MKFAYDFSYGHRLIPHFLLHVINHIVKIIWCNSLELFKKMIARYSFPNKSLPTVLVYVIDDDLAHDLVIVALSTYLFRARIFMRIT